MNELFSSLNDNLFPDLEHYSMYQNGTKSTVHGLAFSKTGSLYTDLLLSDFALKINFKTNDETDTSIENSRNQTEEEFESYLKSKNEDFVSLLRLIDFDNEYENEAVDFVREIPFSHHNTLMIWLLRLYRNHLNTEYVILQMLRFFRCFDFEELDPINITITDLALHHKLLSVRSAAVELMAHWCNEDVLKSLENSEQQTNIILRYKVEALKQSIKNVLSKKH